MALQAATSEGLLERERELDALLDMLARPARGNGGLVVIEGPAGVGKTALLQAGRAAAGEAGLLVLRARGAELERAFGFGVVGQLFDEVLRDPAFETATLFAGAARFAAPLLAVELDGVTSASPGDPFAARHALYWLTANLAAQRPLALLVDDAHWADGASLGVLAHIANRLEGIPAALVVASRTEESLPALDALRRQAELDGTLLHVPPLGQQAAAAVVRSLAPAADDALCRECHAATGGNPFLLHELARAVSSGERSALAEHSPDRVTREIGARLGRLPEPAAQLARAASVLGSGAPLREAAALAGLDDDTAAQAADALVAAGVLRGAHPLEFLHPLVGTAVYAGLAPAARSRAHARAARMLDAEEASTERITAQLMHCQPAGDDWAFGRLVAAAELAAARGAADAVAAYLQRALDEPPPPERRTEILLELGAAETHTDLVAAAAHLREALAGSLALEHRFRAAMLLAGMLGHASRAADAADVLEQQFEELAARPDLRGQTEAAFANITRIDPTTRRRADDVIGRMRARVAGGEETDPSVLGTIAAEMGMAGEAAERTAEVSALAVAGAEPSATTAAGWSWFNAARSLVMSGRYDVALRAMEIALERARARGAVIDVGGVVTFRGELYVHVGDLTSAEVDGRTLHEIATVCGWPIGQGFAAATLGEVLIERGELEEAQRTLTSGLFAGSASELPDVYPAGWVLLARGRLRLAQGRIEDAIEDLRECGRRTLAIGNVNPAVAPWRSVLARALADVGQGSQARRLAAEELELARAFGAPRAVGIALCGMARVAEGGDRVGLLREATEVLDGSGAQLERARARAALGAALRAAGAAQEAREPLREAIDLAHRCGAHALEDAALAELRATGARPRRRVTTGAGALTPSERRIAELAAGGQQNREIAEALFVTTATVEFHLRNAYRKLGVASRTQLADALRG
jgi:DNA-binding CsgD family transcriptional regulator